MTNKKVLALSLCLAVVFFASFVVARSTFLPDWQEVSLQIGSGNDISRDENFCATAQKADGTLMYHKALNCEAPKIFDEFCAHNDEWISECYCPPEYNLQCKSPLRGYSKFSCDGLWSACCNTTCPAGTSTRDPGGCGGSTRNDCGDRCYYPYEPCCWPAGNETGCSCGTYSCSDGCGGSRKCCSACPDPDPADSGSSSTSSNSGSSNSGSSNSGSSNSGSSNSGSSDSGTGTGTPKCSDYGLSSSQPTYKTCVSRTPATGLTCYDTSDCDFKSCKSINSSYSDSDTGGCTKVTLADGPTCYNCAVETCKKSYTKSNCDYPVGSKCTTLSGEERWDGCDTCAKNYPGRTYYCSAPRGCGSDTGWWDSCKNITYCSHGGINKSCVQHCSGGPTTTSSPYVCL